MIKPAKVLLSSDQQVALVESTTGKMITYIRAEDIFYALRKSGIRHEDWKIAVNSALVEYMNSEDD